MELTMYDDITELSSDQLQKATIQLEDFKSAQEKNGYWYAVGTKMIPKQTPLGDEVVFIA